MTTIRRGTRGKVTLDVEVWNEYGGRFTANVVGPFGPIGRTGCDLKGVPVSALFDITPAPYRVGDVLTGSGNPEPQPGTVLRYTSSKHHGDVLTGLGDGEWSFATGVRFEWRHVDHGDRRVIYVPEPEAE